MSNPGVVLLRTNAGLPAFSADYNEDTKQTWVSITSYLQTSIEKNVFGGSFLQWMAPNDAGAMMGPVSHNGGMLDGTVGKEQGCFDTSFLVDGKPVTVTLSGRFTPHGGAPGEPGYNPSVNDLLTIGCVFNQWKSLYLTIHPVRPGMPANAIGCVMISGGYVPIYK